LKQAALRFCEEGRKCYEHFDDERERAAFGLWWWAVLAIRKRARHLFPEQVRDWIHHDLTTNRLDYSPFGYCSPAVQERFHQVDAHILAILDDELGKGSQANVVALVMPYSVVTQEMRGEKSPSQEE
jgi:hypothetical protein